MNPPKTAPISLRRYRAPAAAALLLLGACNSQTVIDKYQQAPVVVSGDDAIVVLGRRHKAEYETEQDFIDCVGKSLSGREGPLRIIPEKTFVDSMYPWFETSTAPMNVKRLQKLLANQAVAARIEEFGIRYVIWVDGSTETIDSNGGVSCAVGPGGGGCFGFASWSDEARYEASIWDLESADVAGKVSTETNGTSYMPAVIVPIPLLARVQANACSSMAGQLAGFITNAGPTAPGTLVAGEAADECEVDATQAC